MLSRFNRWLLTLCKWSAWFGMLLLLGAVFATTVDILSRKLLGVTYQGTIDLVQLCVLAAAFLSIPYAFISRSHVAVAIFTDRLEGRWREAISALSALLGCAIMAAFSWFGIGHAGMQIEYGDVSQTIGIPIAWYWAPVIYGTLLSSLVTLVMGVESLSRIIRGERRIS